jgi:protein SMG6
LTDKKRKQDLTDKNRDNESDPSDKENERIEIWIRSDGTSAVCSNYTKFREEEKGREELEMLTSIDLNKRFVLSFLHVHGKLFSRVGMETFVPVVNQMLSEFHCLLCRSPIPVSSQRLSQLLAINMFAVFHTSLKDTSYGHNCRSLLQEQAIQVTFAMMSLILECAISSLQEHKRVETHPNFKSDDLSELLPTIKLWTDWMSCQKHLWCPPPPPSDFKLNCKGDIWTIFAEFLTALTRINVRSVKLLPSKLEGCEPVILPEDTSLSGFLPLLGSPQCVQFAQPPYDKEKARTCLRVTVIQFFGDYLCGIVEPYLKFDVERKRFVSLIPTLMPTNSEELINKAINDDNSETEIDDYSTEFSSVETTTNSSNDNNVKSPEQLEIEQLWSRQEALKKAKERQEIIKQKVEAVLSEENKRKPSRIIIQPRYIIPDTNCFIDHLNKIKALIKSGYYDLIVPLVVINELNGLKSRGIKTTKPLTFSDDHSGHVGKAAMETIDYLVSAFNEKNLRLKAITSKGSLLDNINFISETFESQGNSNDDFILNACLHFIKDKPFDKSLKEGVTNSVESNSIFREAILLTDDRNLRVKALVHNVPVKSLPVFIKWANIPLNSNRV